MSDVERERDPSRPRRVWRWWLLLVPMVWVLGAGYGAAQVKGDDTTVTAVISVVAVALITELASRRDGAP